MTMWQAALLAGAFAAALVSWPDRRALAWIALVMVSFFVSSAYWDAGMPYPVVFAIALDVVVFFILLNHHRYMWEYRLLQVIQSMVVVNFVWAVLTAGDMDPSHYLFATLLEILNWGALFIIGGGAVAQAAEAGGWHGWGLDRGRLGSGRLRRVVLGLGEPRTSRPWTKG